MSRIPRTRYGFPARAPRGRSSREEIFRPTLGVHAGEPREDLEPGFTPESRNVITDDGYLTRRSGLSVYGGFSDGEPVLGGAEAPDIGGDLNGIAASATSLFHIHPSVDSWSELSYIEGTKHFEISGSFDSHSGTSPGSRASMSAATGAVDDTYHYRFNVTVDSDSTVTVFFYTSGDGNTWAEQSTSVFTESVTDEIESIVTSALSGTGERFGMDFVETSDSTSSLVGSEVTWTEKVSYVSSSDTLSGLSTDYFSIEPIYDSQADEFIAVVSNGTNFEKFFEVNSGVSTFSDYTWIDSLDSTKAAKALGSINDRLVHFNTISSDGTKFPTRVLWSARGNPRSYKINDGAGFEDLMSMKGEGQAVVRLKDSLILLTDEEVWVAQPTLDDYAFRFQRVTDKVGCPYPRTAVATPLGVVFLSQDLEVYVTDGFRVEALGPIQQGAPSRIQRLIRQEMTNGDRAWAVYNVRERRYELYYTTQESDQGYPRRGLFFNLSDGSWTQQLFNHDLTFGFDLKNTGAAATWDSFDGVTWDEFNTDWDSAGAVADDRRVVTFGSGGTTYRFLSDVTNDDGTDIDCRWRSHGLNQGNQMREVSLWRLWLDYDAPTASDVSFFTSINGGASFNAQTERTLAPTASNIFIPVFETGKSPQFEVRWNDGVRVRLGRFQADLRDAGSLGGGG